MKLHPLFPAVLLLLGFVAGCYPPRVENPPPRSPDAKVEVEVKGGRVNVDATTDPKPNGPLKGKDVDVNVRPGGGVDVEVKPKP
jgi:hypothetical protein